VDLRGWVRTSLIDYPDHIATVLFSGGCNFRCPMCHNADLVLRPHELPRIDDRQVWAFLSRRAGMVDGVVLTGGEPTLQADLLPFLRRLHSPGLDIKLDTNGSRPDVLAALLEEGLVDYVAMDVKAPPDKYALLCGVASVDLGAIERSMALLREGAVPYEFRTTVVPGWLAEEDVAEIARWIAGARRYVLQSFRPLNTLDPALSRLEPYPPRRLQDMAALAAPWVQQVEVRG
jgi:pyruvate formate lyase activating enzyme